MACKKCGSDWLTATGRDCNRCPHCDKLQLWFARQAGRWVDPVLVKQCICCQRDFDAVGPKQISQRLLCGDAECAKAHKQAGKRRRAAGVYVQQQAHGIPKQKRNCRRCGKGPLRRDQKDYCSRECAGADAREFKRDFMGISAAVRIAVSVADFFYAWEMQRPDWIQCIGCGKSIEQSTNGQRLFCDEKCRHRYEHPLPAQCCDCGCPINNKHKSQKRCSECRRKRIKDFRRKAKRLFGNYRKRCRHYGVPYDPLVTRLKVFDRDEYVCQLCNCKCLSQVVFVDGVPDPMSPTVDHIVALSMRLKGHTWDNVQCACWACNVAKGARARGQLRLAMA